MVCPYCGFEEYNEITYTPNDNGYECARKSCLETFDEPIEDYEYSEQMKEAKDEDRADEARDMGN